MTILEAIKQVLSNHNEGITSQEVYDEIIDQGLYNFGAQQPVAVVNSQIRRRCIGLDFPSAFPVKVFEIVSHRGKKPCFALIGDKAKGTSENPSNLSRLLKVFPKKS